MPEQNRQLDPAMQVDIENAFNGKLWAYVAVVGKNGSELGVAVANEAGYSPVPSFFYCVEDHTIAEKEADRLNVERGMEIKDALLLVLTTMRKGD